MPPAVDFADVQGLVRFGFGKMTEACFLLLNVEDASAARSWLAHAPVTPAIERKPTPSTALQVAFTRQGLEALQVPPAVMAGFSPEFLTGMAGDENRSRRLGDTGSNAPASWRWGAANQCPHIAVMLFAAPGQLAGWQDTIKDELWADAFRELTCLATSNLAGREQFGFIDGISQPELDWEQTRNVPVNGNQLAYGNIVSLGEFLLGYPNEYARYTNRPLIDPKAPAADVLPDAADQPTKKDLGRNGSYLVIRQLSQDVRTFWRYLYQVADEPHTTASMLAELFVGRAISDGRPMVPLSAAEITGVGDAGTEAKREQDRSLNQFTYAADSDGTHCPFGAHVRRANPRTADLPGDPHGLLEQAVHLLGFGNDNLRADLTASVRFHRLLRRGREYGPGLSPHDALEPAPPDDPERGLHFVAINANIERQFEFIQNAWIAQSKFDGLTEESDPLLGNREPIPGCPVTNTFSIPQGNRIRTRMMNVPRFVTVRGGAYFFLPGIRALKYLSRLNEA